MQKVISRKESKCICCSKDIEMLYENNPDDAGIATIRFHYGSRFDQLTCSPINIKSSLSKLERLLCCDEIEAILCDDCFAKKFELCDGYIK